MRGWLAVIAKEKSAVRQVVGYRELAHLGLACLQARRASECISVR